MHCDETDDSMSRFAELPNALVMTEGIGTRSTASHTCSFGSANDAYAYRMLGLFQKSGGIEVGKPANFLVLSADTPFEAVRQRADVLASIRHGEYLFKRPEPSYDIALDLFRKTRPAQ